MYYLSSPMASPCTHRIQILHPPPLQLWLVGFHSPTNKPKKSSSRQDKTRQDKTRQDEVLFWYADRRFVGKLRHCFLSQNAQHREGLGDFARWSGIPTCDEQRRHPSCRSCGTCALAIPLGNGRYRVLVRISIH